MSPRISLFFLSSEKAIVARCRELLERGRMTGLRYICADPTAPTMAEILQVQEDGSITM